MNNNRITIIAPCYNGESYITRFLDSILAQTYKNIELIVVNDGSKDTTEQILKSYEQQFKECGIKYIHIKQENQGIGASVNNALKLISGKYFTWFGTDDYALPEFAEEMVNFLETNPEFAVVRDDGFVVDEDNTSIIKGRMADANNDKHNPWLFENAILQRNFHFGYSVVRTDIFDKVNPKREIYPSRQGQNWQLLLPIFYRYKSAFYEKPLYCVIDQKESVSRLSKKSYAKQIEVEHECEKILTETLNSMDIPDREKYLQMVKVKYIRSRLYAAIDYNNLDDALAEFKLLRAEKDVTWRDWLKYIRARFVIVHKIISLIKNK